MTRSITTKYFGPTDTKGSRIKATLDDGRSITIGYPYELSGEDVHRKAVYALCDKLNVRDSGWAVAPLGNGYMFISLPE
jgi:hypothetical protein